MSLQRRWPKTSLITTCNAVLSSLSRQLDSHSHLGSPSLSNPHKGRFEQRPTTTYVSETQSSCVLNDSVRTLPQTVEPAAPPLSQKRRRLLDKR